MSPLEMILFLTFLVYTFYYKFGLFLIYNALVLSYTLYVVKTAPMNKGFYVTKQKLLTSSLVGSVQSRSDKCCAHFICEFDVTESMKYAAKLSKENGSHISITHVAIKALALAISKTNEIKGALKWGNVRHL